MMFKNTIEIREKMKWFSSIFRDVIYEDGWQFEYNLDGNKDIYRYRIGRVIYPGNEISDISLSDACEYAEEYGWILNSNIIIGFDINKLTRNKHLLTGVELGLL